MKKIGFILGVLLTMLNLNAATWEQQTAWVLAYENDQNGNRINGNLESLIRAIRNGADVKIAYTSSNVEGYFKCNWVYIENSIVSCMNTDHISQQALKNFNPDAYHAYVLVNTNGDRAISRWLVGEHTSTGSSNDNLGLKWFVKVN